MAKLTVARINSELKDRGAKPRKVSDGQGLYLEVPPKGNGRWRYKFRYAGKENRVSLGTYPDVSLREARERHQEMRKLHARGEDPAVEKQAKKAREEEEGETFEMVAREWWKKQRPAWTEKHAKTVMGRLEGKLFPYLGRRGVTEIRAPDILAALRRIEKEGKHETAHRVLSICGQVMRYAVATGRIESEPTSALRGALSPVRAKHLPAITEPAAFGRLLVAIDGYEGHATTRWALQLAPLVFVRPGELRQAEWREFDFDEALWTIPAAKMKSSAQDHLVPLSAQALGILREAKLANGSARYVFPALTSGTRPMSDMTLNAALRRLGYAKDEVSVHGFRASARTMLDEVLRKRPDLIEHQLAHAVRGPLGRAYNRTTFLDERRVMMQEWADYLDGLKG